MYKLFSLFVSIFLISNSALCQTTFPVNGAPNNSHTIYAFTNCVLHVDADLTINNATLLIQDGKVLRSGEKLEVPKDAVQTDLKGKHIYPAFIDLYSDYGMPEVKRTDISDMPKKGAYGWNQAIKSEAEAHRLFLHNQQKADELRKLGFGSVLTVQKDGIVRGSGALVNLTSLKENESIIKDRAAGFYSFNKGSAPQDYPSSLMGAIALLRQTYYDAEWYKNNQSKTEYNISLDAFNKLQELPAIFEGNDKFNDLRGKKVGEEFKVKYIIKGGGNEYQRIYDIQNSGSQFIIPVNFPEAIDVEDPYDAEQASLTDLKHWEMAPANLAELEKNNVPFCITSADLKDKSSFLKNLRKAIKHGLTEKMALRALTFNPASFIGVQDKVGALSPGKYANFFISSTPIFEEEAVIYETWSNGIKHAYSDLSAANIDGSYLLSYNANTYKLTISKDQENYSGLVLLKDSMKAKANVAFKNNLLTLSFPYDSTFAIRFSGNYNESDKSFSGAGQYADGSWVSFKLNKTPGTDTSKTKTPKPEPKINYGKVLYPFTSYGEALSDGSIKDTWPKFKNRYDGILIQHTTIWTNEKDSVLKDQDVYLVKGKIERIGSNLEVPKTGNIKVIDGKGMHLTPGIVDEHSHIALFSVNEGAEASSAEVRMSDVINSDDINIYRQLSGGVTTAQLLHGSANPIGGQSCLIKLRWGKSPEEFKYENAPGFIKFALGENVKHSNGLNPDQVRFPQTRMGVEQLYYDYFTRATDYKKQMADFSKLTPKQIQQSKTATPRRNLDLEAIAEILDNKRFITCHSYVQSEVNMLMHVADSMKFKINTFTHILEGYKLADKMKAHGANASTFADWWAYKLEVMDAIPYNASMLTKSGVNTAINSDDAEMGRRLNQEAAKTIKYGGLTEVQALKLVTLNPAKMLHIDDKVGSIKVGKVADLVLWTDNPLSIYAKVSKTIIDGQIYYDTDEDAKLRDDIKKERARIIAKLIVEKNKGAKVIKPQPKKQRHFHCDSEESGL
ncbi:MAG: amidohydrolase [Bacteroidetes bacterium]|nr:amidohydrolase [Bacteroidota bacterium]MDF2452192.1 amidohydrolase [Bacteroidota bacterium]